MDPKIASLEHQIKTLELQLNATMTEKQRQKDFNDELKILILASQNEELITKMFEIQRRR